MAVVTWSCKGKYPDGDIVGKFGPLTHIEGSQGGTSYGILNSVTYKMNVFVSDRNWPEMSLENSFRVGETCF